MTDRSEFYAATVKEAVSRASSELGIPEADLPYRIVDEGNSGFLGIGARDARIEVEGTPSPDAAADSEEAQDTPDEETTPAPEPEPLPEAEDEKDEQPTSAPAMFLEETGQETDEVDAEVLEEVRERVSALLDAMGFDARLDVYDAGGFVAADVAPDNTALFIGQKGETIDALQYLVNASVNRRRASRARIVIDAEGYRQRRVEAIQGMAHRTARRAIRELRTVELPPMNPAERRIVHLFLQDNPKVTTDSQGSGDGRRVRISPS